MRSRVAAIGWLCGRTLGGMGTLSISIWDPSNYKDVDRESAKGTCTWSGSENCANRAEFTVIDRSNRRWATCDDHIGQYIRSQLSEG